MPLFTAEALAAAPVRSVLDPGKYRARIIKVENTVSAQKGTPGVSLEFVITPGNMIQSSGSDPQNHHTFATIWSSNDPTKTGPFFSKMHGLADAAGIDLAQFAGMTPDAFETSFYQTLLNREVVIQVANRDYNGSPQEEVKNFYKPE